MAVDWQVLNTPTKRTDFINTVLFKEAEEGIMRLRAQKQKTINRPLSETFTQAMKDSRVASYQKQLDEAEGDHAGMIAWRDGGGNAAPVPSP